MRRLLPITVCLSLILTGLLPAVAPAQTTVMRSQEGLPPELVLPEKPSLEEQLATLLVLKQTAESNRPVGGGFLSGLKGMFSAEGKPLSLPADQLAAHLEEARGRLVAVSGIYEAVDETSGRFNFPGGFLTLSLPTGVQLVGLQADKLTGLPLQVEGVAESGGLGGQVRATKVSPCEWLVLLRLGRVYEELQQWNEAEKSYEAAFSAAQSARSSLAPFAKTSAGRITYEHLRDPKKSGNLFYTAWTTFSSASRRGAPQYHTWVPDEEGNGWLQTSVPEAIAGPLDAVKRNNFWYKFMAFFMELAGGVRWLGIFMVGILSRVVIWPLTKKQLASAEAMKRLQPQIQALQERYADDKQKFQQEFWKLCQANGVNPLGGCLPMLVQFPILFALWNGIRDYIVQFNGHSFLWVKNLAAPDMPLLIAYTASMILFQKMTQKLTPSPTMNAQQQQQQQMMTWMMPLMFFFFFQSFPAAFLLYWLITNIVYFGQQYVYTSLQNKRLAAETEGVATSSGGLADNMVKMLSAKGNPPEVEPPAPKSFHQQQAEAKGKKVSRAAGESSKKGRRR